MLPEDDLALAAVLKSPLLGLDDDDLLALAPKRRGSLWQELLARAPDNARFAEAAETLRRWRGARRPRAAVRVLRRAARRRGHARARCWRGSGPRPATRIDEFLNLALAYDDDAPPSLQGFLSWLREGTRDDQARHGAGPRRGARDDRARRQGPRGADRVPARHLLDALGAAAGQPAAARDAERPSSVPAPILWPVKGTSDLAAVQQAKAAVARAEAQERNRLLYVALTRARDRLYVAGFEGRNPPPADCWYNLIRQGLADRLAESTTADGRRSGRSRSAQTPLPSARRRRRGIAAERARCPIGRRGLRRPSRWCASRWRLRGWPRSTPMRPASPWSASRAARPSRRSCRRRRSPRTAASSAAPSRTLSSSTCRCNRVRPGRRRPRCSWSSRRRNSQLPCARASSRRPWRCSATRRSRRCSGPRAAPRCPSPPRCRIRRGAGLPSTSPARSTGWRARGQRLDRRLQDQPAAARPTRRGLRRPICCNSPPIVSQCSASFRACRSGLRSCGPTARESWRFRPICWMRASADSGSWRRPSLTPGGPLPTFRLRFPPQPIPARRLSQCRAQRRYRCRTPTSRRRCCSRPSPCWSTSSRSGAAPARPWRRRWSRWRPR